MVVEQLGHSESPQGQAPKIAKIHWVAQGQMRTDTQQDHAQWQSVVAHPVTESWEEPMRLAYSNPGLESTTWKVLVEDNCDEWWMTHMTINQNAQQENDMCSPIIKVDSMIKRLAQVTPTNPPPPTNVITVQNIIICARPWNHITITTSNDSECKDSTKVQIEFIHVTRWKMSNTMVPKNLAKISII